MARLKVEIDSKQAITSIKRLDSEVSKFSKSATSNLSDLEGSGSGISNSFRVAAVGIASATAALVAFGLAAKAVISYIKESIDLSNIQIEAETKLEAVLKATGYAAGLNIEQLKEMASEMQSLTTVGDEVILNAQAILASFREIKGEETFKRATMAALDMSAALDSDLKTSILQLGKALNDPVLGMTALGRAGTTFTQQQKDMVKQLVASGDILKAQDLILAEIEAQYGGVAAALRGTFSGALEAAGNAYGDMKEKIGDAITKSEFFIKAINLVEESIISLTRYIDENRTVIAEYARAIAVGIVGAFQSMISIIEFSYNAWKGLAIVANAAILGISEVVGSLVAILRTVMLPLDLILKALVKIGTIDSNPFDVIADGAKDMSSASQEAISSILNDVEEMNKKFDTVRGAGDKVVAVLNSIDNVEVSPSFGGDLVAGANDTYTALETRLGEYVEKIKSGNDEIANDQQSLQNELRGIAREGFGGEEAWNDTIDEINKYTKAAEAAAKAGDWKGQLQNLKTAKDLISELPKGGVRGIDISDQDVARAKSYSQSMVRAYNAHPIASKLNAAKDAIAKYNSLLNEQRSGTDDIITKQESINTRLELTRKIGEAINENKGKGTVALEAEAKTIKETMDKYKEELDAAKEKTEELSSGTAVVGAEWEKVGGVWTQVSTSMVGDVEKIEKSLDSAIKKMNELNSKSPSSSSGIDGARALGGPVAGGGTYLVGERGPELFTPSSSGAIIPNNKLQGSEKAEKMVDINLSIGGSKPVPLKGSQTSIDDLYRQMDNKKRYAA